MKKLIFLSSLIFLAACASQPAVQPTTTLLADTATATALPTATFTPEPTDTPTLEPIPEGTYTDTLPARVIAVVRDGVVVEIEEGPIEVAIDAITGRILFERIDGQWMDYKVRIFVIGEAVDDKYDGIGEIPTSIIESAEGLVLAAEADPGLTQNGVPVQLGLDTEREIRVMGSGSHDVWWFGINLGTGPYTHPDDFGGANGGVFYVGTRIPSGDILIVQENFGISTSGDQRSASDNTWVYANGEVPERESQATRPGYLTLNQMMSMLGDPRTIGEVIHIRSTIYDPKAEASARETSRDWNLGWMDFYQVMLGNKYPDDNLTPWMIPSNFALSEEIWRMFGYGW